MTDDTKVCRRCGKRKTITAFEKQKYAADNHLRRHICQRCHRGPLHYRIRRLKRLGVAIGPEEQERLKAQTECAICGAPATDWDHDQAKLTMRDALCNSCNTGIGQFREDTDRLMRAVQYLQRWGK